mmetsp:Transcript_14382/g.41084  ORF Transcript_14382/g.41084 Transcript_14382/m.41084 type:complete len:366 (-) Transcript_14382:1021-2118(-)
MHVKESLHLGSDFFVTPALESVDDLCVSVHGVAHPSDFVASVVNGPEKQGKPLPELLGSHPNNDGQPSGVVLGVQCFDGAKELLRVSLVAYLDCQRVSNTSEELHVRVVELPRSLSHPNQVGAAVVPQPGGGVLPRQGALVLEKQGLVRHVEFGLRHDGALWSHPARLHEGDRVIHSGSQVHVELALVGFLHKVQIPLVHPAKPGVTSRGEAPNEVQSRRALVVRFHEPVWVWNTSLQADLRAINDVTSVRRVLLPVDGLCWGASWLGELARHAAHFHNRNSATKHHHHRHLKQHSVRVTNVVCRELLETLGAVSSLQPEGFSSRALGQLLTQVSTLSCKDQRRQVTHLLVYFCHIFLAGVVWLL